MSKTLDLNECFPMPGQPGAKRGPLPKQQDFLNKVLDPKGPKFVAYMGGYGSGKTFILCIAVLTQAVMYGGEYTISRAYNPELLRTTWKQFLDILPKDLIVDVKIAAQEIHIKSAAGKPAVIYFVGLDDPQKLDSMNLSGFAIDEGSQVPEEPFLKLQGRLRNPNGLRKGIVVGNPRGKNWIYRRFLAKVGMDTPEKRNKYALIVAPSTENVHLDPDYVQTMLDSYSPERIQRDIYGSFDSFEGMIFTEFRRDVHVIKPFEIPDGWSRIIGADHGYTNPAAFVWGAVDFDGNVYIYQEYYKTEKLVKEIAQDVTKLTGKTTIDGCYIDPSTKAVRSQTGFSDFGTYLDHLPKNIPLYPAKNDVTAGIDRLKTYLKLSEKTNKPKLYIFDTCINLIEEVTQYQWEELGPGSQGQANEKEKPKKYFDHAVDALRYLIMSRPETPRWKDKSIGDHWETPETRIQQDFKRFSKPEPKDPFGDM